MKVKFNPFLKEVRGKIGDTVFRLCHTGEWQIAACPNMSRVKWSEAQKAHRRRFRLAIDYANACMIVPELRAYYLEMARKQGTKRPFDEAVRHYFQGHNLIWDGYLDAIRKKQQNDTSAADVEHPASDPASESTSQQAGPAVPAPSSTQPAGPASRPSPISAPTTGPAPINDPWTFAASVPFDSTGGQSSFYCVSTMCTLDDGSPVGLPAVIPV